MRNIAAIVLLSASLTGCVVGSTEDAYQFAEIVLEFGWTCRDVGKPIKQCKNELRGALFPYERKESVP